MDFSVRRQAGQRIRCFEQPRDSDVQMVFIPGPFDPEIWEHQLRYFSKNYYTLCCATEESDFSSEKELLEHLLEKPGMENAVLVSFGPGNALLQSVEEHEKVVATVMTGATENIRLKLPENIYTGLGYIARQPKIAKKLFFSDTTDYRIVKKFTEEVDMPDHSALKSFSENYSIRKPVKNSLLLHADRDRFSSREFAKSLKPNVYISQIKDAGSFSFYEKPEEYNKAVLDFLNRLEGFVESRNVKKTRQRNRSLREFERDKPKAVIQR